jgi:hypothetical protein
MRVGEKVRFPNGTSTQVVRMEGFSVIAAHGGPVAEIIEAPSHVSAQRN